MKIYYFVSAFLFCSLTLNAQQTNTVKAEDDQPWRNAQLPVEKRVELLLTAMTPTDKMDLLRENWGIPGNPRLGIPDMKKVEAIHGFSYGSGATVFPQSIGLGATWDKQLVEEVAGAIGDETKSANAVRLGRRFWMLPRTPVGDVAKKPTAKIPFWFRRLAAHGSKDFSRADC